MNKNFLTFIFLATALVFSVTAKALPVEGLLGCWRAQETLLGQGVNFQLRFVFQQDATEMEVTCLYPDSSWLRANVRAATNYSANEIYIQQTNQSVINDGLHYCRATLQPTRWTAYFDGTGRMILFAETPFQSRLTLIRDEI